VSSGSEGRHALIVATAHYSDPKLQQLRAPAADAERLAEVLSDPGKGNFDVEVLLDQSQAKVARRIASFFRDRRPDDLLFLHFSCHGVKDDRGELFLATADTEIDLLSATGVSAAWLNDQISRTRSRRTVVLLDCCFSGSFPFGMHARAGGSVDAPEQLQGRGRAIITASSAMEYAYEGDQLQGEGRPSVFTEAVVEGLDTGEADLDHDQWVSVDDLYNYVYDRVKERTPSQTPNKKSELEGPLYLARSSYRPEIEPATLDADLLARTEDRYAGIREGAVQELSELLMARDAAVALAARQALSEMTGDDSRRVSSRAQVALEEADRARAEIERAEAERAEAERAEAQRAATQRAEREPVEIESGILGETGDPAAEPASVSQRPGSESGSSVVEDSSNTSAGVSGRAAATGSWLRSHVRLVVPAAVIAVAGVAAVLVASLRSDGELPNGIPASLACQEDASYAQDLDADTGYRCGFPASAQSPDVHAPDLRYAVYSNAQAARNNMNDNGRYWIDNKGGTQCGAHTDEQMRSVYSGGPFLCLIYAQGHTYISWVDNDSSTLGIVTFSPQTTLSNAVDAWAQVVTLPS
jgi:Caspase domain